MATTSITPGIVGTILWAKSNSAHTDHLHVEPPARQTGTPPASSGMSEGVRKIYDELVRVFGPTAYFPNADATTEWTHMGWFNRRYIAGTTTWSQHAYGNALDIGPYHGVEQQQKFYDFLTGKEVEVHTKADHAAGHWQGPNAWGDNAWAEYQAKGYTSLPESRTWELRREDLAWFRQKFLTEILALIPSGDDPMTAQDVRNIIRDAIANG